jgi:hypothetical protein
MQFTNLRAEPMLMSVKMFANLVGSVPATVYEENNKSTNNELQASILLRAGIAYCYADYRASNITSYDISAPEKTYKLPRSQARQQYRDQVPSRQKLVHQHLLA